MPYIDLSKELRPELRDRAAEMAHAIGFMVRDEIVEIMESYGPRSGRRYYVPGTRTTYVASAPGEPPAIRTGTYRSRWKVTPPVQQEGVVRVAVYNDEMVGKDGTVPLWYILNYGSQDGTMAPRPHVEEAVDRVRRHISERFGAE